MPNRSRAKSARSHRGRGTLRRTKGKSHRRGRKRKSSRRSNTRIYKGSRNIIDHFARKHKKTILSKNFDPTFHCILKITLEEQVAAAVQLEKTSGDASIKLTIYPDIYVAAEMFAEDLHAEYLYIHDHSWYPPFPTLPKPREEYRSEKMQEYADLRDDIKVKPMKMEMLERMLTTRLPVRIGYQQKLSMAYQNITSYTNDIETKLSTYDDNVKKAIYKIIQIYIPNWLKHTSSGPLQANVETKITTANGYPDGFLENAHGRS